MATYRSLIPVIKWKIGLQESFGKGITRDDEGRTIFDLIEVMGHREESKSYKSDADHGFYGDVEIYDSAEEDFAENASNQDSNGLPDYENRWNVATDFVMKNYVENEVVYICRKSTETQPTSITLNSYPIIKDFDGLTEDEITDFFVVNPNGQRDSSRKIEYTYSAYDSGIDRIGNLAGPNISIRVVDYDGNLRPLKKGQMIVASYWVYTHTDNLRDFTSDTYWSSQDNDIDTYIIIDLNPGSARSTMMYNNLELVFRNISYSVGPYEYILQGANVNANNRERFKLIASGYLPAYDEGQSYVIKFDTVDYRYLKLILIGSTSDSFMVADATIGNSRAQIDSGIINSPLDLNNTLSGDIKVDDNDFYTLTLSDYDLVPLNAVYARQAAGLINFLYHKEYLEDNYSLDYGVLSGDFSPLTGALNFSYQGNFALNHNRNSVGLDFGISKSCDYLLIRDSNTWHAEPYINELDVYYSDDNVNYVEASGARIKDISCNGLGTDIVLGDFAGYGRYWKVNFPNTTYSGNFQCHNELMISPDMSYYKIASMHYVKKDMFEITSQMAGDESYLGLRERFDGDFLPLLFNRDITGSGYSLFEVYGQDYYPEYIYDADTIGLTYSGDLTIEDFYMYNAIPYYADLTNVNSTLIKGEQVAPSELVSTSVARMYIPGIYNGGEADYSEYELVFYNIRYGTEMAYQGLPAGSNIDFTKKESAVSIRQTVSDRTNELVNISDIITSLMTRDILKSTTVGNNESLLLQFFHATNLKLYAIHTITGVETLLTENTDYVHNPDYKKVITDSSFTSTYDSHYIVAEYEYPIFKLDYNYERPMVHFTFLRSKNEEEKIQLGGLRIYPETYFKDYLVNDNSTVFEFEVNPAECSIDLEDGGVLVKVLDGGRRQDNAFIIGKHHLSISAPKITDEMRDNLTYWTQHNSTLGLVDDMRDFYKGFIVPGSFKMTRRKTTAQEQEDRTSSYSYNLEFQEM